MPDKDNNFGGSLVLDFRKWWRHAKTIYCWNIEIVVCFTSSYFLDCDDIMCWVNFMKCENNYIYFLLTLTTQIKKSK